MLNQTIRHPIRFWFSTFTRYAISFVPHVYTIDIWFDRNAIFIEAPRDQHKIHCLNKLSHAESHDADFLYSQQKWANRKTFVYSLKRYIMALSLRNILWYSQTMWAELTIAQLIVYFIRLFEQQFVVSCWIYESYRCLKRIRLFMLVCQQLLTRWTVIYFKVGRLSFSFNKTLLLSGAL